MLKKLRSINIAVGNFRIKMYNRYKIKKKSNKAMKITKKKNKNKKLFGR